MNKALFCLLFFASYALSDFRIPQPLPKGTPEPPLAKAVNTQVIEGLYLVTGKDYKSTAFIAQPPNTKIFIVYQYTGKTVTEGIGFMHKDEFVVAWQQNKTLGASVIRFKDGNGECTWVSNPGNGVVSHETWKLIADD